MHFTTETALDYVEGRFDTEEEALWSKHMEMCPKCTQDVLLWQQFLAAMRGPNLASAPVADINRALNILSHERAAGSSTIRSVMASVIFDSFRQPALEGIRGAASSEQRQLVLRADEFDIHIKIWGEEDNRQMLGQLLPRNGKEFVQPARFHLLCNLQRLQSTATDETGEFRFHRVPTGDLSLQIDLPNLTIVGALNVQQRR